MRHFSRSLAIALLLGFFVVPPTALAAIPFFGPIIPDAQQLCPGSWYLVMVVINNIISFAITFVIVFITPVMIAYSGFLMVANPFNPGAKEEAKKMLTNTVVGIVISLASWMIVDALMAVLYNPSTVGATWSELVTGGTGANACLKTAASLENLNQTKLGLSGSTPDSTGVFVNGKAGALCADGNTACSVGAIKDAAAALNMPLSDEQLATMSCIAMTESSGNPNSPNSSTGACGTFQITNRTRKSNWQNPAYHQGACSTASSCNNATCNLQTALIMFKQQGYQPWTGKNKDGSYWNPNAVACAREHDPVAGIRL